MKLLLDSCVWGGTATRLRPTGHDAVWSGDWPADPGDEEILARAFAEGRVLVTLDKDFGELAIVRGLPHAGILRLVGLSALQQAEVTRGLLRHMAATSLLAPSSPRRRTASGSASRSDSFAAVRWPTTPPPAASSPRTPSPA